MLTAHTLNQAAVIVLVPTALLLFVFAVFWLVNPQPPTKP
jgi:hypothetical protein